MGTAGIDWLQAGNKKPVIYLQPNWMLDVTLIDKQIKLVMWEFSTTT